VGGIWCVLYSSWCADVADLMQRASDAPASTVSHQPAPSLNAAGFVSAAVLRSTVLCPVLICSAVLVLRLLFAAKRPSSAL
jgi:hypothetical protein